MEIVVQCKEGKKGLLVAKHSEDLYICPLGRGRGRGIKTICLLSVCKNIYINIYAKLCDRSCT